MLVYVLNNCDSCRKATKFLQERNVAHISVDIRKTGIARDKLHDLWEAIGDDLINKRSTTWRALSQEEREMPPVELLMMKPTVMKRPVFVWEDQVIVGWNAQAQSDLLARLEK